MLERIRGWREICPDIAIRSTFIVGFPGETEEDFDYLLDWLDEAQLDRVGAFRFEPVEGAARQRPARLRCPKRSRKSATPASWRRPPPSPPPSSRPRSAATIDVIIDEVDDEGGATGRSKADAPEIDGEVHLRDAGALAQGDIVRVLVEDADEHDLFGVPLASQA